MLFLQINEFGLSRTTVLVVESFIILLLFIYLKKIVESDRHVPKTLAEKADP